MSWGWYEGGKRFNAKSERGFASREAAIEGAVHAASGKRDVASIELRDQLWASLERAGWRIEYRP